MQAEETLIQGLKVGILTYDYVPSIGGLGVLAETYVRALRKLRPESVFTVISPARRADERCSWLARLRWRKSGGCPLFSLTIFRCLPKLIKKHRLDVLHVHAGSGGVFLLRRPPCPVVVTSHHTYRQEAAIVFETSFFKRVWKSFMARLERRTYQLADLICCVSADTRTELVEHYGVAPEKVIVVENPVSFDSMKRFRGLPKEHETILFVGRMEERKGIMLLLDVFREVSKEFPNAQLRLVGRNLIGGRLDRFLGAHQLSAKVTSLGYVHDPFRFREMAQATVLVVPSKLEGFGLVAAEGMMLGTCVIVSNAPGLKSIVEDGKTGLVFKSDDREDFLRAIRSALTNAEHRSQLEASAMERAEQRFSVDDRAAEMMNAFASVVSGGK